MLLLKLANKKRKWIVCLLSTINFKFIMMTLTSISKSNIKESIKISIIVTK